MTHLSLLSHLWKNIALNNICDMEKQQEKLSTFCKVCGPNLVLHTNGLMHLEYLMPSSSTDAPKQILTHPVAIGVQYYIVKVPG
jgi:hypothetical protein